MTSKINGILEQIEVLSKDLEEAIAERRRQFEYELKDRRARFEKEALLRHRALRVPLRAFLAKARLSHIATAPVIYSLIVPFVLMDFFVSLYQAVCFPAYGIPKVLRRDHIRIDRHHLAYLNALQKFNCVYCGYCNGLISYVREIAGRTEAFWCPIKHAGRIHHPHDRYPHFLDYGDAEAFEEGLQASRRAVLEPKNAKDLS
jgi:hypothetical protein